MHLDAELLESMQISVTSPKKRSILGMARSIKFVLRDKKKMEALVKELCYWNDSLDKMTSRLEQESARRRLRVKFSTGNVDQLQDLQAAAALLQHRDLENMASARTVIEKSYNIENSPKQPDGVKAQPDSTAPDGGTDFRLEMNQLNWQGLPFMTDQSRAMATYRGEGIIVDWRLCRDDTWRRQNPKAFRQRTENLTRVLNSDLRALNVAVLHCIGYLDQSSTVTGYAFKVPPDVTAGQKPITLHQLLTNPNMRPSDVPDLGDRFELAKVLATTVFEILNIGWLHKNIREFQSSTEMTPPSDPANIPPRTQKCPLLAQEEHPRRLGPLETLPRRLRHLPPQPTRRNVRETPRRPGRRHLPAPRLPIRATLSSLLTLVRHVQPRHHAL